MAQQGGAAGAQFAARIRPKIAGTSESKRQLAASLSSRHLSFGKAASAPPGSRVLIEFILPNGGIACRVAGEVLEGAGPGLQLQITNLDKTARELVRRTDAAKRSVRLLGVGASNLVPGELGQMALFEEDLRCRD